MHSGDECVMDSLDRSRRESLRAVLVELIEADCARSAVESRYMTALQRVRDVVRESDGPWVIDHGGPWFVSQSELVFEVRRAESL